MNYKDIKYPVLGAAYYPEAWDESEQDRDIAAMQKAGIKVARMAEFAWAKMEPREGEYHFEWLHKVIDKLDKAGIATMLGTPTATPPMWLEEKFPEMMVVDEYGRPAQHGGRRNNCSNNADYRRYSAKIVEKMAQEFGADERVMGWQIDNEIYSYGSVCYCDNCKKAFAEHLKKKFGTIDELNKRWNLNLFSQWYDSFEQVPMPKSYIWHGPHLRNEWQVFKGESHIDFVREQAEILRKYTKAPIGTDMMQAYGVPYERIAPLVDVIQFNHYDTDEQLDNAAFWFDYLRNFKERPFWNTETSTCWNGGMCAVDDFRVEGFCTANTWLPILLGGEMNMYWLWRQHWAGHEIMHGAVLYASGKPMHMYHEITAAADGFNRASDFLRETKVKTDTAILHSAKSVNLSVCHPIAKTYDGKGNGMRRIYNYISKSGIRPDVISPIKSFKGYKLLFTPYIMTLEEQDLIPRITEFVKDGGVWVAGPLCDIRNADGALYTDRSTGLIEKITGCELVQQIPDAKQRISFEWSDGEEYKACHFLQLFDICEDATPLVKATGGFSSLVGMTLVFSKNVGKGKVIVIGALPDDCSQQRLMDLIIAESGVDTLSFEGELIAAKREGETLHGIAAQEIKGENATLYFEGVKTDILTGKTYEGKAEVAPFGTVILCDD